MIDNSNSGNGVFRLGTLSFAGGATIVNFGGNNACQNTISGANGLIFDYVGNICVADYDGLGDYLNILGIDQVSLQQTMSTPNTIVSIKGKTKFALGNWDKHEIYIGADNLVAKADGYLFAAVNGGIFNADTSINSPTSIVDFASR